MARLRAARRRSYRRRGRRGAGILGLALVAIGMGMLFLAFLGAGGRQPDTASSASSGASSAQASSSSAFSTWEVYLAPLVAQDPKPFASLARADRDWMLKTAVWFASEQACYQYTSNNRQAVPAAQVLVAYRRFFGSTASPQFGTFSSGGVQYVFHADTQVYDVPVTAERNVYTPRVTAVRQNGDTVVVTVAYIPGTGWVQKADGTSAVPPAPTKTMRYTLRRDGAGYTVVSVQTG